MDTLKLTSTQQVTLSLAIEDKRGNPAQIDGKPNWSTSDSTKLSIEPSEDGKTCLVKAVGPVGAAQVSVEADADLGEGVVPINATGDFEVIAGQASAVKLSAGTPEEQPA